MVVGLIFPPAEGAGDMSEDSRTDDLAPKEFSDRLLKAARLYHLCGEEEDSWSTVALAVCAFEGLHTKDGWEFVLTNRLDIENVAKVFGKADSPEEFKDGILELKEQDLKRRMGVE